MAASGVFDPKVLISRQCNMPEDPVMPCESCLKTSVRVLKQPCVRVSILTLKLHRYGLYFL